MVPDLTPNHLGFRDLLLPGRALAATGAEDNPLLVLTRRRLARWHRWVILRLFELLLFAGGLAVSSPASPLSIAPSVFRNLRAEVWFLLLLAFTFALLRYHLLINDQSRHIKAIDRDQLEHLLLTRMTREDYFLHHLLAFCLHYRVVVGWAVIVAVHFLHGLLQGEYRWVESEYFGPMVALLFVVVMTWVAGVLQYVVEWRLHAGRRVVVPRLLTSLPLSLVMALPVTAGASLALLGLLPGLVLSLVCFAAGSGVVLSFARTTYADSERTLWDRFTGEDVDYQRSTAASPGRESALGMLAEVLLPWLWTRPRRRWRQQRGGDPPRVGWRDRAVAWAVALPVVWLVALGQGWLLYQVYGPRFSSFDIFRFAHPLWSLINLPPTALAVISWLRWRRQSSESEGWGSAGFEIPTVAVVGVSLSLLAMVVASALGGGPRGAWILLSLFYVLPALFGEMARWAVMTGGLAFADTLFGTGRSRDGETGLGRLAAGLATGSVLTLLLFGGGEALRTWSMLTARWWRYGFQGDVLRTFMVFVAPGLLALSALLAGVGLVRLANWRRKRMSDVEFSAIPMK